MKQSQEPKKLRLVKLTPAYRRQLLEMMEPWLAQEQDFSPYAIRKNDPHDFEAYLTRLEVKEATPEGLVPESVFFCLDEERDIFVGAVSIRHSLGPKNCVTGGHIGDGVRPEERRKGYATAMIGLALEECRKLGIHKVLMTCDVSNIGSARSIEKNGGVLESQVEEDGVLENRYWITLGEEEILTPRTVLRREMPADFRDAFAWSGDARVYRFLLASPCRRPEDMLPWLRRQDPNSKDDYVMIIRSRTDGHAIGTVAVFRDPEGEIWTLAYNLRRDEWGKGYATEAARALIDYVRDNRGARVIEAECAIENTASARVMERLGMAPCRESSYRKHDGSAQFPSRVYRMEL